MKAIFLSLFLLISVFSISQRNVTDTIIGTPYCGIQYTAAFPEAELGERYGYYNMLGGFAGYKTKRNWIFGLDGNFMFGDRIREEGLFDHLLDSEGNFTTTIGTPGRIFVYKRGFNANLTVGKVIPIFNSNPNSGLLIKLGGGYVYHKIRIESQEDVVPPVEEDYRKGYDRLTIGFNSQQLIGYSFMANKGIYNFYAGFYFNEGFTKNQRDLNWDQPDIPVDKSIRFEFTYGLRAGWLIPIYKREPKDFYFE